LKKKEIEFEVRKGERKRRGYEDGDMEERVEMEMRE
jgi:hypothetical protein